MQTARIRARLREARVNRHYKRFVESALVVITLKRILNVKKWFLLYATAVHARRVRRLTAALVEHARRWDNLRWTSRRYEITNEKKHSSSARIRTTCVNTTRAGTRCCCRLVRHPKFRNLVFRFIRYQFNLFKRTGKYPAAVAVVGYFTNYFGILPAPVGPLFEYFFGDH